MARKSKSSNEIFFEKFALKLSRFSGTTTAFVIAFSIIVIWAASGKFFGFSEVWQLVINTCTTIVTFLMVFLIQRAQNKDSLSIQLKLNEIIASISGASNKLVDIEDISERDLLILKKHYQKLSQLFEKDYDIKVSHSIEEAESRHKRKVTSK
ncbi:MAG: low affinity iron permease family protein [Ignavibacteria bacterium]|nr:low affinity iron permease family protein [Ignavibacteria bacterium]